MPARSPSSSPTRPPSSPAPAWSATAAIRSSLTLLAAAALAACDAPEPQPAPVATQTTAAGPACEQRSFEGSRFTACRYDPARHRIELVLDGPGGATLRSLPALEAQLGPNASSLLFAMNAGMYDEEGRPIGLYIEEGEERRAINLRDGPGNFHLKPNGVLWVDAKGHASVTRSDRFSARGVRFATQSGPMLLIDGKLHPKFDEDGESRLIRNGVGVSGSGAAWFAISEEGVSFGRFARFFRDALGCSDALYLDGTVSSLWDPGAGRQDPYGSLGPLIAVYRKP